MSSKDHLAESIARQAGCDTKDANKIISYYLQEKIVKIDKHNGGLLLTHGAFMDKDVLLRALETIKKTGDI